MGIHDSLRCHQQITQVHRQSWEISGGTIYKPVRFWQLSPTEMPFHKDYRYESRSKRKNDFLSP
jgi:hypothetical protein